MRFQDGVIIVNRCLEDGSHSNSIINQRIWTHNWAKNLQGTAKIMLKANRAYLAAVKMYANVDIWKWLPKYFLEQRQMMAEQTNTLVSFIKSDMLSLDIENYMLEPDFKNHYKSYCNANSMTVHKWSSDYWQGPFAQHGIERKEFKKPTTLPDGTVLKGWVLKGVALKKQREDPMEF